MLKLLLLLQIGSAAVATPAAPPDTVVYASPRVRDAVERAARLNRLVPGELQSYRARVESEMAMVLRQPGGYERTVQLEQVASDVRWRRTGEMEQRVVGYRAQSVGATLSALSYMSQAWTVPVLYGNRLTLFFGRDTARDRADSARTADGKAHRSRALAAVHPLADDRERVYRFSGGDTIATVRADGRAIPIVRVRVEPRVVPDRRTLLFRGEMDLDATRHHLVRLRGQFVTVGGDRSVVRRLRDASLVAVLYMELVNRESGGRYWLPAWQRIEAQGTLFFGGDTRSVFRVITRFGAIVPNDTTLAIADPAADTLRLEPHRLTIGRRDSLSRFDRWESALGEASAAVSIDDFAEFAPEVWKPSGAPRLDLRPERFSDVARYNRVEGLYLGVPLRLRMRDAWPGVTLYAQGGRAFSGDAWRGTASATIARDRWRAGVRGGRTLWSTNDFLDPWDEGLRIDGLFEGKDEFDYVDRRFATFWAVRELRRGATARVEAGPASDRAVFRSVRRGGLIEVQRDGFRHVRYALPGRYARGAAIVELHPEVGDGFVRPGVGARLQYEAAAGALRWQKAEARLAARRTAGAFTLAGRLDAGAVFLHDTVSQQLYELGGREGLPGYDSKTFGGDRALLGRTVAMYTSPWLRAPVPLRLRRWRVFLPGVAPALAASLQGGWADASDGTARAALVRLGMVNDPITGEPVPDPEGRLRAPVPTDGIRSTAELSLRFFGGAVALGVARPVDHSARWRFVFRLGEEL